MHLAIDGREPTGSDKSTSSHQATDPRLTNEAWEALLNARTRLMRTFAQHDVWGSVTMREYDVLYTLRKGPMSGLRLNQLNDGVLLSQPSLSRMVDRMEQRGLVERHPAPDDARGILVALTQQGRDIQREVGRRHARQVTAHVGGALDDAELRELQRLCDRLANSIASDQHHPAPELSPSRRIHD